MSFVIYALREIGSMEVRYIGQTGVSARHRMRFFIAIARQGYGELPMREWLRGCDYKIEAVVIGTAETREEAKAKEKALIEAHCCLNHRLLQKQWVLSEEAVRKMAEAA